jgi:AcrR family transcriptional regulator
MSLREQQRALTERAILDAVLELVAEGELDQLSVPAVARRSGVSVATIYRHFPTKDALLDAAAWVPASHAEALRPTRYYGAGFRDYLVVLWSGFAENLPLVRRQVASSAGRGMRARRLEAGRHQLGRELAELGIDPTSEPGQRLVSLCLLLGGSLALLELHDRQGIAVDRAADEVAWAAQVLLDATRREALSTRRLTSRKGTDHGV